MSIAQNHLPFPSDNISGNIMEKYTLSINALFLCWRALILYHCTTTAPILH